MLLHQDSKRGAGGQGHRGGGCKGLQLVTSTAPHSELFEFVPRQKQEKVGAHRAHSTTGKEPDTSL